jgi:ATP-dependent DNA helicase DinG
MSVEVKKKQPSLDAAKVLQLVSSQGILARVLKGFEFRKPQQEMMRNVIDAYNDHSVALIEAGTGTGKSLAYLLPAILWALENHQRTLISTHTIALQEQLITKDIPQITKALNLDIKAVLIKGMGNYLCLRKFHDAKEEQLLLTPEEKSEFDRIEAWTETTKEGSRSSLPVMPSNATWERINAENDTCSYMKCPHYQKCFFFKARAQAEDAQILVANHHLLFADLAVRAETDNYKAQAIMPAYSRIIIDEAHHIEDIATDFFGAHINRLNLLRLIGKIASESQTKTQGKLSIIKEKLLQAFPNPNDPKTSSIYSRLNIDLVNARQELLHNTQEAFTILGSFVDELTLNASSIDDLDQAESKLRLLPTHQQSPIWQTRVIPATERLISSIHRYVQGLQNLEQDLDTLKHDSFQEQSKGIRQDMIAFSLRLEEQALLFHKLIITPPKPEKVRWMEIKRNSNFTNNISIRDADLDVSQSMVEFLFSKFSSIVLCSATLTTNSQFQFIRERLGLNCKLLSYKKVTESIYDSPFNYAQQAMLTVPIDLPLPHDESFISKAAEQIWQALVACQGGAFVLFTSYSMMKTCYELLVERLNTHRYKTYKQGDAERQVLLAHFKKSPKAVLFGTDSFWEGIDVAGEALKCVIIVKLPFKVPTEPVIQARTEAILARGGDPFNEYTLPTAIVKFKQGFGRLIRHVKDRGCIVCLDTRLLRKNYGKQFLNSLPPCQQSFVESEQLIPQMRAFYRKTHHLVTQA